MLNENLEKLVRHARDKKPTDFKEILTSEIDDRIEAKVSEIKDGLAKNMFKIDEDSFKTKHQFEHHEDDLEHTHEDGTVHTHPGGDVEHTHDEEVAEASFAKRSEKQKAIDDKAKADGKTKPKKEGTLPPALQKAIDAKKKDKGDDDEDKDDDKEQDENIANFGDKKAKPFKKDKKEDIRDAAKKIMRKEASGGKEAYQKYFTGMLKKFNVKSAAELKGEEKKKFFDAVDAGWDGDNESD